MGNKLSGPQHLPQDIKLELDTTNKRQCELICGGYIRQNKCALNIPNEINTIIQQYFLLSHVISWKMSYDELLNASETNKIKAPCFKINSVPFSFFLSTGRYYAPSQRLIGIEQLTSTKITLPESMTFCIKLNCHETMTFWKSQHTFISSIGKTTHDSLDWRMVEVSNRFHYPIHVDKSFIPKHKYLTFSVEMELLYLKYSDSVNYKMYRSIQLDNKLEFEWNINDKLGDQFLNASVGEIFWSKSFGIDDNFKLFCFPNCTENTSVIQLVSMRLPYNKQRFKANICYRIKQNEKILSEENKQDVAICPSQFEKDPFNKLQYELLWETQALTKVMRESASFLVISITIDCV